LRRRLGSQPLALLGRRRLRRRLGRRFGLTARCAEPCGQKACTCTRGETGTSELEHVRHISDSSGADEGINVIFRGGLGQRYVANVSQSPSNLDACGFRKSSFRYGYDSAPFIPREASAPTSSNFQGNR
jgi:hypothetical protein